MNNPTLLATVYSHSSHWSLFRHWMSFLLILWVWYLCQLQIFCNFSLGKKSFHMICTVDVPNNYLMAKLLFLFPEKIGCDCICYPHLSSCCLLFQPEHRSRHCAFRSWSLRCCSLAAGNWPSWCFSTCQVQVMSKLVVHVWKCPVMMIQLCL